MNSLHAMSPLSLYKNELGTSETIGDSLVDPHLESLHKPLEQLKTLQHKRVLEGLPVWDLSMVNPDMPPPRLVLDRLLESVTKATNHRYAVSRGVRRLREAFSSKYAARFDVKLDPETQVCVCLGSKDATFHALRVMVGPGESVIVAAPSYPTHPSAVALTGARSVPWEVRRDPEEGARSLDLVISSSGSKLLLLNLPSNPSGVVVSQDWWRAIGEVCARRGVSIINDFVYGEMCFSGVPARSALSVAEQGVRVVEVYSLSKAYNVPGWRVGALVGDPQVVGAVSRVKSLADYGLFLPLQYAATVALTSQEELVRPTVQTYERRLKVLHAGLLKEGWKAAMPQAGACLWAEYPGSMGVGVSSGQSLSMRVANSLLSTAGVVVTPGVVFGRQFDHFIRFAAVTTEERLREVVSMISGVAFQGAQGA